MSAVSQPGEGGVLPLQPPLARESLSPVSYLVIITMLCSPGSSRTPYWCHGVVSPLMSPPSLPSSTPSLPLSTPSLPLSTPYLPLSSPSLPSFPHLSSTPSLSSFPQPPSPFILWLTLSLIFFATPSFPPPSLSPPHTFTHFLSPRPLFPPHFAPGLPLSLPHGRPGQVPLILYLHTHFFFFLQ